MPCYEPCLLAEELAQAERQWPLLAGHTVQQTKRSSYTDNKGNIPVSKVSFPLSLFVVSSLWTVLWVMSQVCWHIMMRMVPRRLTCTNISLFNQATHYTTA